MIFKTTAIQRELSQIKDATHYSLKSLRKDVLHAYEWVKFLAAHDNEQTELCAQLKSQVASLSASHDVFRAKTELVSALNRKFHELDSRIAELEKKQKEVLDAVHKAAHTLHQQESLAKKVASLEHKTRVHPEVVASPSQPSRPRPVTQQKHNYQPDEKVREKILEYIQKHQPTPSTTVRSYAVSHMGWCSKSAFYRAINTLIQQGDLTYTLEGREKILRANKK